MKPTRLMSPPGTYFVTFSTWQRRRLFVVESYSRLFLKTMYGYRRAGKFRLHAFVLMPEHVHLLFTPTDGVTLERAMQLIKGGYSHAFGLEFGKHKEVWERGFTDHRIRNSADFEQHVKYIHENPVKRGLVEKAADYRYCAAYPGFKLDPPGAPFLARTLREKWGSPDPAPASPRNQTNSNSEGAANLSPGRKSAVQDRARIKRPSAATATASCGRKADPRR